MGVSTDKARQIVLAIAQVIEENKQYLTDLDAAIGDNDHGLNMARGFSVVEKKLSESPGETVGDVLKTTAMALISNVGGASGPLYGTLFLKASGVAKDKTEVNLQDFADMLADGIVGVQARGKAELGEKTMLDVLIPVQKQLTEDAAAGITGTEAVEKAAKLARDCAEKTKDIKATKGRASYLGERSIGHIDPGAMSSCLIMETIATELTKE